MAEKVLKIDKFYGGIVRDDKANVQGGASNIESIDIFTNANYIQAEQKMTADSMPATTEVYAYCGGDDDTTYGYGKETSGSKVRIVSVAAGGANNPGSFTTLATESDATNLARVDSPITFFETTEVNGRAVYYIKGAGTSWYIARYNLDATQFERWDGTQWTTGTWDSNSKLTGLTGTNDRLSIKVIYGGLYITNGNYIANVDKDGLFTEQKFTLPLEWRSVDIEAVGSYGLILCRHVNITHGVSRAFWWDLDSATSFEDQFSLPTGGPQWVISHKEQVKIFCAINGTGRFYQLSGAFPGAQPQEIPQMTLSSLAAEASTQPISPPKSVAFKDNVLYFGVYKTDKTGIFAIGQIDSQFPQALILSRRFEEVSAYTGHKPIALHIQGPNFYAAYVDSSTNENSRCETNNTPDRSGNAIYESIWIDDNKPFTNKQLVELVVRTQPLGSSTSVTVNLAKDYGAYATAVLRADGTDLNTANAVQGVFSGKQINGKCYKVKLTLSPSGATSPKVVGFGLRIRTDEQPIAPN